MRNKKSLLGKKCENVHTPNALFQKIAPVLNIFHRKIRMSILTTLVHPRLLQPRRRQPIGGMQGLEYHRAVKVNIGRCRK